ncbi:MAG: CBS domain-containing protein [Deltaproteobacteria bacterium]|nr:CBS domain-containing protein [Deltaproteobacteria bacterium]
MKIKDIMLTDVDYVMRSTTLSQLLKIYDRFHSLPIVPVVDENKYLVGHVSIADLIGVFSPTGQDLRRILASLPFVEHGEEDIFESDIPPEMGFLAVVDDFMNRNVVALPEEMSIKNAYRELNKLSMEKTLVVNKNNQLVGIIGVFDIIRAVFREKGIL